MIDVETGRMWGSAVEVPVDFDGVKVEMTF